MRVVPLVVARARLLGEAVEQGAELAEVDRAREAVQRVVVVHLALERARRARRRRRRAEQLGLEVDVAVRDAEDRVQQAWLGLGLG